MRKLDSPSTIPNKARAGSADFNRAVSVNEALINDYVESNSDTKPTLKFPGYEDGSIKEIIRSLANGCCGYCGQRVESIETVIVEHFRPKAKLFFQISPFSPYNVKAKIKSGGRDVCCDFGYFEYGDDLNNMIPACSGCNTGEGNSGIYITKYLEGTKRVGLLEKDVVYGKSNFFPIYGIHKRSGGVPQDMRIGQVSVRNIEAERPLLFNPLLDDPDEIFAYKKTKVSGSTNCAFIQIRPNPNASKYQRLKAEASISLLGLNRKELCHKRADKRNLLVQLTREVVSAIKNEDWSVATWQSFTFKYSNQFKIEHSEIIGFSMVVSKRLGFTIRSKIIEKVICSEKAIFTNDDDFFVLIKELIDFSITAAANPEVDDYKEEDIDLILDSV